MLHTPIDNTILPLIGYYSQFQGFARENYQLIATMGDDMNAGGAGDIFNDFNREMFCCGKHYLPSDQLILLMIPFPVLTCFREGWTHQRTGWNSRDIRNCLRHLH
jgi:hypothetical protein